MAGHYQPGQTAYDIERVDMLLLTLGALGPWKTLIGWNITIIYQQLPGLFTHR